MVTTNKNRFNKRYGQPKDKSNSKADISRLTGISKSILDKVYDRGVGAYRTNPQSVRPSVKSPQQWAMARVYSFAVGGKTRQTADKDLWEKHKKNKARRKK
tara:strand:+ start:15006 stop:15308 length:303 start_codon:yes stop_codon:yes gene_type:complete